MTTVRRTAWEFAHGLEYPGFSLLLTGPVIVEGKGLPPVVYDSFASALRLDPWTKPNPARLATWRDRL